MLPSTTEQFIGVFERYNLGIWPVPIVAYALGVRATGLAIRPARSTFAPSGSETTCCEGCC